MLAVDLNRDDKPDIAVGYVHAPGVIYFNSGDGKHFRRITFGDDKVRRTGLRLRISMEMVIRIW